MILSKPLKIGSLILKNRMVMSAMATGYPDLSGEPNKRFIQYLERRAKGQIAMIIVESTGVLEDFRYNVRTPSIAKDETITKWRELTKVIHQHECYVCLQLQHPGRQVYPTTQGPIISASSLPTRVTGIVPRAMTIDEIKGVVQAFADGAKRAQDAGVDAIEIHAGHGYLFSQFLSTASNIRKDNYGGSLENRSRFLLETVKNIQQKVGKEYPIIVRLSFEEFTGEGITLDETLQVAKWLEDLGIAAIRVSGGSLDQNKPAMIPPTDVERGLFWPYSKIAKEKLTIPVDIVGRIQTPELAEQLLEEGYADFISLGRPLIADPDYAKKALASQSQQIRPCIACNQGCIDRLLNYDIGEISCLMNPHVGQEGKDKYELVSASEQQKIVIVGAGPAGLESAHAHAMKGHQVIIIEKESVIGGLFTTANLPPGKQDFSAFFDYYSHEIERLNITLILNQIADDELVASLKPDKVIWAIGSEKKQCVLPTNKPQFICEDIFYTEITENSTILVYGAAWEGVEVALYLRQQGHQVVIIEPNEKLGEKLSPVTRRWYLKKKLKALNVGIFEHAKNIRWEAESCIFEWNGKQHQQFFDIVVTESLKLPKGHIMHEEAYKEMYIGDCMAPQNAFFAMKAGFESSIEETSVK